METYLSDSSSQSDSVATETRAKVINTVKFIASKDASLVSGNQALVNAVRWVEAVIDDLW